MKCSVVESSPLKKEKKSSSSNEDTFVDLRGMGGESEVERIGYEPDYERE